MNGVLFSKAQRVETMKLLLAIKGSYGSMIAPRTDQTLSRCTIRGLYDALIKDSVMPRIEDYVMPRVEDSVMPRVEDSVVPRVEHSMVP
ncbi:hypothetical protein L1987_20790 [Smallanthus sonchifolius]|uniref:Uncharacterized protein n=1 Tax=Smallanthus sonchifolius TaxID=185202 RepID=A0ACB9IS23_9ASTR|nr:hypothetical protein L1987_20790 [Smallanthus sonchifolius]